MDAGGRAMQEQLPKGREDAKIAKENQKIKVKDILFCRFESWCLTYLSILESIILTRN